MLEKRRAGQPQTGSSSHEPTDIKDLPVILCHFPIFIVLLSRVDMPYPASEQHLAEVQTKG